MRVRCLDCQERAALKGRCPAHYKAYENSAPRRRRRKRREVLAHGRNAAALMRKAARRAGYVRCAKCRLPFLASAVDVDHITPLSLGGEDVPENVQFLCRPCHKMKTRADFGTGVPPF